MQNVATNYPCTTQLVYRGKLLIFTGYLTALTNNTATITSQSGLVMTNSSGTAVQISTAYMLVPATNSVVTWNLSCAVDPGAFSMAAGTYTISYISPNGCIVPNSNSNTCTLYVAEVSR